MTIMLPKSFSISHDRDSFSIQIDADKREYLQYLSEILILVSPSGMVETPRLKTSTQYISKDRIQPFEFNPGFIRSELPINY
jgi:hypothetical protein